MYLELCASLLVFSDGDSRTHDNLDTCTRTPFSFSFTELEITSRQETYYSANPIQNECLLWYIKKAQLSTGVSFTVNGSGQLFIGTKEHPTSVWKVVS